MYDANQFGFGGELRIQDGFQGGLNRNDQNPFSGAFREKKMHRIPLKGQGPNLA